MWRKGMCRCHWHLLNSALLQCEKCRTRVDAGVSMATVAWASDEEAVSPHASYTHAHFDVVHHLAVWARPFSASSAASRRSALRASLPRIPSTEFAIHTVDTCWLHCLHSNICPLTSWHNLWCLAPLKTWISRSRKISSTTSIRWHTAPSSLTQLCVMIKLEP